MSDRAEPRAVLERLERDGLIRRAGDELVTTRRWQAAMARAALRLGRDAAPDELDLRLPIAAALVELYADARVDELVAFVAALLPLEAALLAPLTGAGASRGPPAR